MTNEQKPIQYMSNYPRSHVDFDPEEAQALLDGYHGLTPALVKCFFASVLVYFVSGVLFGVAGGSYELAWIPWLMIIIGLISLVYFCFLKPLAKVEQGMGWAPGKHKRVAFWTAVFFSPLWGAPVYAILQILIARRLQRMGLPANPWTGIKKRQAYEIVEMARQVSYGLEPIVENDLQAESQLGA